MLLKWSESSTLSEHVMMEKLRPFLSNFIGMIASLEKSLRRRKPRSSSGAKTALPRSKDPVPTASKGVRRSYSATSLKTMVKDDKKIHEKRKTQEVELLDRLRDEVRDKLRGMVNVMKSLINDVSKNNESREVVDRLTFILSMENGFMWDDAYASDQLDEISKDNLVCQVLTKCKLVAV